MNAAWPDSGKEIISDKQPLPSACKESREGKEELQSTAGGPSMGNRVQRQNLPSPLNSDTIANLLVGARLPVVVVGPDITIRHFTPQAEAILNIHPTDAGRPISDLQASLGITDLEAIIRASLESGSVQERDVKHRDGTRYVLRVRPHRTMENKIDGSVLMLLDANVASNDPRDARQYAEAIVQTVDLPLIVLDGSLRVRTANTAFYNTFQTLPEETENRCFYDLGTGQWNNPQLRVLLMEALTHDRSFSNYDLEQDFPAIGKKVMRLRARPIQHEPSPEKLILMAIRDITEQKVTQQLLQRQARLLDLAGDAIFVKDVNENINYWNHGAERLYGWRKEEVMGQQVRSLVRTIFPEPLGNIKEKLTRDGYWSGLLTQTSKDGHILSVASRWTPELDSQGNRMGVIEVNSDITELQKAALALGKSRAMFETLYESYPDGVIVTDTEGRIARVNRQMEKLFGYSREELLGKEVEILLPERYRNAHLIHLCKYMARPRMRPMGEGLELYARGKSGDGFPVSIILSPLETEEGMQVLAVVRDITARLNAEKGLRLLLEVTAVASEAEDILSMTTRCLTAICRLGGWQVGQAWSVEADGTSLRCDPNAFHSEIPCGAFRNASLNMTTTADMYLMGQDPKSATAFWISDLASHPGFLRKSAAAACGLKSGFVLPIKSGQSMFAVWEFFCDQHSSPNRYIQDAMHKLGSHLGIVFERKQADKALHELSFKLMHAQEEERRRIAQDLHNTTAQNLAAITMNVNIVREDAKNLDPHAAELLTKSSFLAQQVAEEIRTVSYLLHPPLLDDIGLAAALDWYIEGFSQRSGVKVTLDVPSDFQRPPREIEFVLYYVAQEGLTNVHRHSGGTTAKISILPGPAEVTLELSDDGKGIPPNILESFNKHAVGVGVGLASMRERVKRIGGHFEIIPVKKGTLLRAVVPIPRLN